MLLRKPYISLAETLHYLKIQAVESLFTAKRLNITGSPKAIFYQLKKIFFYHSDPSGTEMLQQLDTLLNLNGRNRWRVAGCGDCDCMVIGALAILWNANYKLLQVVVTGNKKENPSHIYIKIYSNGKWQNFDLTEKNFNTIRPYRYLQIINISLN